MSDSIKIIVASHKKYQMPSDPLYLPVHVGAENKAPLGYTPDNTGENISDKNAYYCELTGLYWMWKNLKADYLGLVHYRRYFTVRKSSDKWGCIATEDQIFEKLKKAQIILPRKRHYFIETNYSQYAHAHHAVDLDTTREIISEKYPSYLKAFDESMSRTVGHRFNMFVMSEKYLNEYCTWLFDILFELEKRLDISSYSDYDSRVFGLVSERLTDVWIDANGYKYVEMPVIFMENEHWIKKGFKFLKRKIKKGK